jgi:hypothetical protein
MTRVAGGVDGWGPGPGDFVDVRIDGVSDDIDFVASLVRVADVPGTLRAVPRNPGRILPLASIGSWGR